MPTQENQLQADNNGRNRLALVAASAASGLVSLLCASLPLAFGGLPYAFTLADLAGSSVLLHEFCDKPLIVRRLLGDLVRPLALAALKRMKGRSIAPISSMNAS